MKKTTINFLKYFSFAIGGLGLGVSGFWIFKAVYNKKDNDNFIAYKPSYSKSLLKELGTDLKLTERHVGEGEAFLGDEGLNKLISRIVSDLDYGPEIIGLQSINITNDEKYIEKANRGYFSADIRQIFINSNTYPKKNANNIDSKVEFCFQIISHEYLHFISSSYIENTMNNTQSPNSIYRDAYADENKREVDSWNPWFIDQFTKLLNYDKPGTLYDNPRTLIKKGLYDATCWGKNKFLPVYSQYTASEIFKMANGNETNYKKYDLYKEKFKKLRFGGWHSSAMLKIDLESLKYLFSVEELFARKYQQINMIMTNETNRNIDPFMEDTLKYFSEIPKKEDFNGTPVTKTLPDGTIIPGKKTFSFKESIWMTGEDAPYRLNADKTAFDNHEVAKELNKILLESMGQSTGTDIAYITHKNTSQIGNSTTVETNIKNNLIKFGGYIGKNESQKYKYVGYKKNSTEWVKMPIKISEFKLSYKEKINSSHKVKVQGQNYFYTINDWIDFKSLKGKPLYYIDENGQSYPMLDLKSKQAGKVSNYSSHLNYLYKDLGVYEVGSASGTKVINWRKTI